MQNKKQKMLVRVSSVFGYHLHIASYCTIFTAKWSSNGRLEPVISKRLALGHKGLTTHSLLLSPRHHDISDQATTYFRRQLISGGQLISNQKGDNPFGNSYQAINHLNKEKAITHQTTTQTILVVGSIFAHVKIVVPIKCLKYGSDPPCGNSHEDFILIIIISVRNHILKTFS